MGASGSGAVDPGEAGPVTTGSVPSGRLSTRSGFVLDERNAPFVKWFPDGVMNTCYNALDRHVINDRGEQTARAKSVCRSCPVRWPHTPRRTDRAP